MTVPLLVLAGVAASFVVLWIASLPLRNASIVDPFWGAGFVLAAWLYVVLDGSGTVRSWLVPVLVTVWGLRLSIHLFLRNRGKGEDFRYRAMRESWGDRFAWVSLFTVFVLQALILWVVALPVGRAVRAVEPTRLTWLDGAGTAVFAIGLFFEAVGDAQLRRFKSDPGNRGKVLDHGLWRYTRHPNYFGDAMVWWGLTLPALATPGSWWVLTGPVLMTLLLMRVSGVTLLEKSLEESKPGYRDYVERTPAFIPWFPK